MYDLVCALPLALPAWYLLACSAGKVASRNSTARIIYTLLESADCHLAKLWLHWKKFSWKELEDEPQQSRPRLKSQVLVWDWCGAGLKWWHQQYILERVPRHSRFEFRFTREGENLCTQESLGTFSAVWCLPPTLVPIIPPHSDRQNLCWSSGSQNLPLILELEDCYLNRRKTSLLSNHQQPLHQHQDTCEVPGFRLRYNFFLGTSCHSRENQCCFNRHYWHKIDPLKGLAFLEKHKWIAELTTFSWFIILLSERQKNLPRKRDLSFRSNSLTRIPQKYICQSNCLVF